MSDLTPMLDYSLLYVISERQFRMNLFAEDSGITPYIRVRLPEVHVDNETIFNFRLDGILEEKKMAMSMSPSVTPSGILLPASPKSHHARLDIRGAILSSIMTSNAEIQGKLTLSLKRGLSADWTLRCRVWIDRELG